MNRPNDTRTMLMSTLVYFWIDFLVKVVLSQQVKLAVFFSDAVSAHKLKLFQRKLVELVLHLPYIGLLQLWDGLFSGRFLLTRFPQVRLLACSSSQRQSKMQVTQKVSLVCVIEKLFNAEYLNKTETNKASRENNSCWKFSFDIKEINTIFK